jgi:hypothetical protein
VPPGAVAAAVEVHDSMFGGIVAVLRGVDCWRVTVAPRDIYPSGPCNQKGDLVAELADDARFTSTCPSSGRVAYPITRVRS